MTTTRKTVTGLGVLWGIAFLARPGYLSVILPPILFFLAWTAVAGPTFKTSPRHPDIARILHKNSTRRLILRPNWVPPTVRGIWRIALVVALLGPGLLVNIFAAMLSDGPAMTFGDAIWWLIMMPAILSASTLLIEAIILQIFATPFTGLMIVFLLLLAPSGSKLGGENPATFLYWAPSIILFLLAIWALWLLDLLRAIAPFSQRHRHLMR